MTLKQRTSIVEVGGSKYVLIPKDVLTDSSFPFNDDDNLEIQLTEDKMIISYAHKK